MAKIPVVGLVLALASCQTLLPVEGAPEGTLPVVDRWDKNYEEVFAETRQIPALSSDEIVERIEFMHSTMDQVRDRTETREHMIHAVDLWYGAIMDKNASHCHLTHFNNLNSQLNHIINMREPPTNNKDRLFELFYDNVGNFCRQVLADSLRSSVGHIRHHLKDVEDAYDSWTAGNITKIELAKKLFHIFDMGRSRGSITLRNRIDYAYKWRGTCPQLQKLMPYTARVIYELVQQDVLKRASASNEAQETIDFFFKMVRVCDELDPMIPDLARFLLIRKSTNRFIPPEEYNERLGQIRSEFFRSPSSFT